MVPHTGTLSERSYSRNSAILFTRFFGFFGFLLRNPLVGVLFLLCIKLAKAEALFYGFFLKKIPSDAKCKPAATHALTQPRRSAEGARSVLPMPAAGTIRLMPFLPD
jgi:hypothetical protein